MNKGGYIVKCGVLAIAAVAIIGFITMLLWNWLVPDIFKGPAINYWQSLGLLLLSKILFSGFGKGSYRPNKTSSHWKYRFVDRFSSLSPEEKERFKARVKDKWCSHVSEEKNTGTTNV